MNFIFDVGDVLVTYEPIPFLRTLFTDKATVDAVYNAVFRSSEWVRMDQGFLTRKEAVGIWCVREPELQAEIRHTMQKQDSMFVPKTDTLELLPGIKQSGHGLYYLSNMHLEVRDYLISEYQLFEQFDGGVFSCDVHLIKPYPEIYRHLLEEYRLAPEDCVFFDDVVENVDAAKKEGIYGVLFTGAQCVGPFLR